MTSKRTKSALCAAAVGCAGLAAFATTGFSDDPTPKAHFKVVSVAMQPEATPLAARESRRRRGGKRTKPPKLTDLITTNPVDVPANEEIVAELSCSRAQGIPLSGGAIAPPAPAEVAISVISRFSPNPPFDATPRSYFIGVRNFGDTPQQFRGTLTCAKGIKQASSGR